MKLKGLLKGLLSLAFATALTAVPVYAQEDNTLTIGVSASFDKLDPTLSSNYPAYYLSEAIFEPLFHWNQLNREFEPRVALSYSVNETYDVWTFVLRQGVKFSDGSELTADDVAFTFNRIRDPETKSSSRSSFASISDIVVIDKYTLEIHTAAPDPYLLRNVSSSSGVIVSRAFYEGKSAQELNEQPMGSGPYKLGDWQKGQAMTLVPNEHYWGNAAPIANVVMVPIPEVGTRVSALLTGEVDLIDDVQLEDIERIEADPAKQIVEVKDGFVQWLYFDTTRPPFDDIEMRKAFVHAIDLEGTLDALLGERYTLLTAPISPRMVEYNNDLVAHAYDPDLSQQILAGKGGPVTLNTFTSNGRYVKDADIYAAINDQVSAVGFNVNPQVLEWGTLIGNMIKGEAGPFALIGASYEDGNVSRLYPRLTGMASWKPGAEFEELYRQVSLETDNDKATALWQQMLAVIHDDYLIAGTWQVSTIRAADKRLSFAPSYSTYMLLTDISWSAN